MGVVTFVLTALVFTVVGMVIMAVIDAKAISDTYVMGYKAGYKVAKEESEIKWVVNERTEERTLQ